MLEPRFTRGEYWLLETAVNARIAFPHLWDSPEDLAASFNKPGHGLGRCALVRALDRLFQDGLIVAQGESGQPFVPRTDVIDAMLDLPGPSVTEPDPSSPIGYTLSWNRACFYYGLTAEGGAQWEAFAAPNWDEYCDAWAMGVKGEEDVREGTIIAADPAVVELRFDAAPQLGHDIEKNSVQWDVLKPWDATYWKVLPRGYRLRYRYRERQGWCWDDVPNHAWWVVENRWYRWG